MNNSIPQVTLVYDRKKQSSKHKEGMIEIRICHNYKKKYISTGLKVLPNQWKNNKVVNHPDASNLNWMLDKKTSEVRKAILDMVNDGDIDITNIPELMKKENVHKVSFLEFCMHRAEVRKYGKSVDNQRRYDRFLRFLKSWGKIKSFEDINESNVILLDRHLDKMKPNSRWYNYHRFLNSFIIDAINEGFIKKNPYKNLYIEKGDCEGINKHLTPNEFERIRNIKLHTESLERVRDLFIFQTYTCLSYSDLKRFDVSNIREVNGMKVYAGQRKKTGRNFTIPLLSPALEILDKYNQALPIISNVKYNAYLKVVAQAAGIDKPVSSHWARHTGATLLLNEGVDMQIVSKICGHSSIRMTERIYAKLLDETVVNAVRKLDK